MGRLLLIVLLLLSTNSIMGQPLKRLQIDSSLSDMNVIYHKAGKELWVIEINSNIHALEFEINVVPIYEIETYSNKYVLYIPFIPVGDFKLIIKSPKHKEEIIDINGPIEKYICYQYEVEERSIGNTIKKRFRRDFTSSNNFASVELGKGNTFSPMGGGFGASFLYRFGDKTGWGINAGVGYMSNTAPVHSGKIISEGSYTISGVTHSPHFSAGIKCYPFLWANSSSKYINLFAQNFYIGCSYGILGVKEFQAYNNSDGSFSLGGIRTKHGISILAGEDWKLPLSKSNSGGIIVSFGIGTDYSYSTKDWSFAYDIGIGWYWGLNRIAK